MSRAARRTWLAALAMAAALVLSLLAPRGVVAGDRPSAPVNGACVVCHTGIEEMHPWAPVSCVQCHGGNADAATKETAHIVRQQRAAGDERVLGPQFELEA